MFTAIPIALVFICLVLGIVIALVIKYGSKALAWIFGGVVIFATLVAITLIGSYSVRRSYEEQAFLERKQHKTHLRAIEGSRSTQLIQVKESHPIAEELSLFDSDPETPVEVIETIEVGSQSESLENAPDWVTADHASHFCILKSDPYLGSAYTTDGKTNKSVRTDLMNQLSNWLASKYDLDLVAPITDPEQIHPFGTTHQELFDKFVTKMHIVKNETSVGETETLYVLAEKTDKNLAWLTSLRDQQRSALNQSRLALMATGLGGGLFVGLITLYGLLSVGTKPKETSREDRTEE